MKTPDALLAWFDQQLDTLPPDDFSITKLQALLEDPPIGVTQLQFRYKLVPLSRSGPKGWTFFPATDDGTRLARFSYTSLVRGASVTAIVKLRPRPCSPADTDSYKVSEQALITIDHLNGHGRVEYRETHSGYKRRKLDIDH
jgi:hypothetical protein